MKSKINSFVILLAVLSVIHISCATKPDAVTDDQSRDNETENNDLDKEKPQLNIDYDPGANILYHNGWKVSAPPGCYFQTPVFENRENELFRVNTGNETLFVLNECIFDFVPDYQALLKYIAEDLRSYHEITESGDYEISGKADNRTQGKYWVCNNKTVMLEKIGERYFEWRLNYPLNIQSADSRIADRIIKEAVTIPENISGRSRNNGFSFISLGTPWRWRGDLADGFILECLVPEESAGIIAAFFSIDKLGEGDSWFKDVSGSAKKIIPVELQINGEEINTELYTDNIKDFYGSRNYTRIMIPVEADNLHEDLAIIIYHEVVNDMRPDPVSILNLQKVKRSFEILHFTSFE